MGTTFAVPNPLPLSSILNVSVFVEAANQPGPAFNQALIVGPSTIISTTIRTQLYESLADMSADGFNSTMPEYLAAALYFGAQPVPTYLWIGRQGIGETPLEAVTACRANPQWYACMVVGTVTDAEHLAVAEYIESVTPASLYFLTVANLTVDVGSPETSLLAALQALALNRTFSLYSTTQSNAYPSNAYAVAAVMGTTMGLNTFLPGSYFTIMFKTINLPGGGAVPVGVQPEPLSNTTTPTIAEIAGVVDRSNVGLNGNLVLQYANGGIWTNYGVMASGRFLDQVIFLDMLVAAIQQNGVALLQALPSVPITDAGVGQMKNAVSQACVNSQTIGFIAPSGTWLGPQQLGAPPTVLAVGQAMPKGYWVYAQPVSTWPQSQRANRVMPPITVALVQAQAGQSLAVTVYVQP